MNTESLKKNKLTILSLIAIVLVVLLAMQENTISDLSFNESTLQKLYGYSEPEGGVTYIEALGLEYITLGSIFNYGVTKEVVLYYFESLMNETLAEESDELLSSAKDLTSDLEDSYLALEGIASIEYSDYVDFNGEVVKDNQIMTIMVPNTFNKDNIETTSNVWKFDYHLYQDSLIGVKDAIWYSQLFETSSVFDRAWTSLKWLCQDKIQCEILEDLEDVFTVLVYGSDGYCWYIVFERNYGDVFNFGKPVNYISMSTTPLTEEDAYELLSKYGLITELETN